MLDFHRNNLYTHFCFSELLILREKKKFANFFLRSIEISKKIKIFEKYWKNTIQESCTKKGSILHQAPQITLFFDSLCLCIHFCFLNFWFWEKKRFANFQKYWKYIIQESFTKKAQFCTRRRKSHFFLTHPVNVLLQLY